MRESLKILYHQVDALKENYYCLIGSCINILDFSNYTVMYDKEREDREECLELNRRIKDLYEQLQKVRDNIVKL